MKKKIRDKRILVRFTDEEYAQIKKNVAETRLFTQNYFRKLLAGQRASIAPSMKFFELNNELNQILVNLTQLSCKAIQLRLPEANQMWFLGRSISTQKHRIFVLVLFGNIDLKTKKKL